MMDLLLNPMPLQKYCYSNAAILVIQKLCEATEVPFEQPEPGRNDVAMWISLFSEAWDEVLEESIF